MTKYNINEKVYQKSTSKWCDTRACQTSGEWDRGACHSLQHSTGKPGKKTLTT